MDLKKITGLALGGVSLQLGKRALKSDNIIKSAIYTTATGVLGKISYDIITEEDKIDEEYKKKK